MIEIIVALSILGVVFFALVQLFPFGADINESSRNKTIASFLAQEKVEELYSKGYGNIATGTIEAKQRLSDEPQDHFYNYKRETQVNYIDGEMNFSSEDEGMKRVSVFVYYPQSFGGEEQFFQLDTIITKN